MKLNWIFTLLQLLDSYGVTLNNLQSAHQKVTIKKNIVDMAKDWPIYFSRIFPVSVSVISLLWAQIQNKEINLDSFTIKLA